MEKDQLSLKWGTLKSWCFHSKEARALLGEYGKIGASMSAATQDDTPRQKEIICELIEIGNFENDKVYLDWDDVWVGKDAAKKYVRNYGKELK